MRHSRLAVPLCYLGIWGGLVLLLFLSSMRDSWVYLLSTTPLEQAAPRHSPAVSAALPPSTAELLPPAPVPPLAQGHSVPAPAARSGRQEVSNPRFATDRPAFTAHFDLGVPCENSRSSWQQEPAAWMVDVPGRWQRVGREEYAIRHPLIRKVRIMLYKDKLRLKFYFSDRRHKKAHPPVVNFTDRGVSITIQADKNT